MQLIWDYIAKQLDIVDVNEIESNLHEKLREEIALAVRDYIDDSLSWLTPEYIQQQILGKGNNIKAYEANTVKLILDTEYTIFERLDSGILSGRIDISNLKGGSIIVEVYERIPLVDGTTSWKLYDAYGMTTVKDGQPTLYDVPKKETYFHNGAKVVLRLTKGYQDSSIYYMVFWR